MSRNIFIFMVITLLWLFSAKQTVGESESEVTPEETMKEHVFRDFQIRIYSDNETGQSRLEILKKGRQIYEQQADGKFFLYQGDHEDSEYGKSFVKDRRIHPKDSYESVPIGRDITGKGIPDLVISEWTGGAHCCYKFYVFELDEKIRTIAVLDVVHGSLSHFADLDGDNIPEFITQDWTFAYWNTSFADSPAPGIILRFDKDRYVLAEKLMRKSALSESDTEKRLSEVRADESWQTEKNPPPLLWKTMLDLIYTGNADAAWKFFDKAWDKKFKGKKKFLREFRGQLEMSPYWSEVEKMNTH